MARSNLQIKVGTYTGNGVAREITGIGFNPDLVIVKGGANDAVVMNKHMARGNCSYLSRSTGDVTTGIIQLSNDGFFVGTGVTANENSTVYYYIAIRGLSGQSYFRTGKYVGDGVDNRDYSVGGLDFTPDLVSVKDVGSQGGYYRTSDMTTEGSMRYDASAGLVNNIIQAIIENGFQLGAGNGGNAAGQTHYFWAMKAYRGVLSVFTYTGDGTDNRDITGIGFQPDATLITADGAFDSVIRTSSMTGDTSGYSRNTAFASNNIQSFLSDGIQIGSSDNVNKNGVTYYGWALKAGDFNVPITRNSI